MTPTELRAALRQSPGEREVRFVIYGNAVPMARPRVVRTKSGKTIAFNPANCTDWKNAIAVQALSHRPSKLLDGALLLVADFYLLKPKSKPKKQLWVDTKPDWDNLAKAVTDALEGLIYTNDSRIVEARITKQYGDPPRVEIHIQEVTLDNSREGRM